MRAILRMRSLLSPIWSTFSPHLVKSSPLGFYLSPSQSIPCDSSTRLQIPNFFVKPSIASLMPLMASSFTQSRGFQAEASPSSPPPSGEIHVIVGPMFAGKTTTLLRRVQLESECGSFQAKSPKNSLRLDKVLKSLCCSGRLSEAVRILGGTGVQVDPQTYSLLLQECIYRKEFRMGKRVHAQMIIVGFVPDEYLEIKLLILYAKSGNLETAHIIFNKLPNQILISWNAMISGYVEMGLYETGLSLYCTMRQGGLIPDQFTFASIFRAYASLAILELGKQAHAVMLKCKIKNNLIVNSALMDMYFKCSSPDDGLCVFNQSLDRNIVTWTALISGYGQHGRFDDVLELFRRMISEGFRPNSVTFLAVLWACSHKGLVNEGLTYFSSMVRNYGIQPSGKHFAAVVDLLGRAGKLKEAYEFVQNSPCGEHPVVWGALLGACRIHGDLELVELAARKYFELEPENPDKYLVLSSVYATFGLWNTVSDVRRNMKESGMKKEPAYSRIEIQGHAHFFLMGDKSHELSELIYKIIKDMTCLLKDAGYGLI